MTSVAGFARVFVSRPRNTTGSDSAGASALPHPRQHDLSFWARICVAAALLCAIFVRVGVAKTATVYPIASSIRSAHLPLKCQLLDPRDFDWSTPATVVAEVDFPEPIALAKHLSPEPPILHSSAALDNRPPPRE